MSGSYYVTTFNADAILEMNLHIQSLFPKPSRYVHITQNVTVNKCSCYVGTLHIVQTV
jgi:hypothetical protein